MYGTQFLIYFCMVSTLLLLLNNQKYLFLLNKHKK